MLIIEYNCIADSWHRSALIDDEGWDAYYAAAKDDTPTPLVPLIKVLAYRHGMLVVTDTPERHRQLLLNWLIDHGIMIDELVCKANDDFSPAWEAKAAAAAKAAAKSKEPVLIIGRDDRFLANLRDRGYTTMEMETP